MKTQDTIIQKQSITVEYFYNKIKDRFPIKLLTEPLGFERIITDQNLHRPGLALAGFVDLFSFTRVQIFGNTEIRYLKQLDSDERIDALERIFQFEIPCVVLTDNNPPIEEIFQVSEKYQVSVLGTEFTTTKASNLLSDLLDDQFAPRFSIHGSFVDVYGVGMLFIGKSGIGKSEIALDLVERGHRLVADDVVILTKKGEEILMGSGTDLVKHFMEIRGIGIIDVRSMFGVRAIRYQKRMEIVLDMEVWDKEATYTRTGLDDSKISYLDVNIPYVKVPIIPGKNITVISEVIALNYLLKHYKYDAAKIFKERLNQELVKKSKEVERSIDYFGHDFE